MNNEIAALRGRLAHNETVMETIATGIDVDIDELRMMLDKYTPKQDIPTKRIRVVTDQLLLSAERYKALHTQTESIKKDLE